MIGEIVAQVMLGVEPVITSEVKVGARNQAGHRCDGRIFCTQYEDCCEVKRFVACHMQSARVRYNQNKRTSEWKKLEAVQESIREVETKKHKVERSIGMLCESRDMTSLR